MRKRLDSTLCERGYFESRSRARAAVMERQVMVDGSFEVKPGTQLKGDETIEVVERADPYVSRGGRKLEGALDAMGIEVGGAVALDVGSSTGGFTDCLLRRGAARVYAVDVGRGQLHQRLREDARVSVIEGFNARGLEPGLLPETPSLAVVDVSFISLTRLMVPIFGVLAHDGRCVALVKPQFEAGRKQVGKGGVVRDPSVHLEVLERLARWMEGNGMSVVDSAASPLKGPKGNAEYFVVVSRGLAGAVSRERFVEIIDGATEERRGG